MTPSSFTEFMSRVVGHRFSESKIRQLLKEVDKSDYDRADTERIVKYILSKKPESPFSGSELNEKNLA